MLNEFDVDAAAVQAQVATYHVKTFEATSRDLAAARPTIIVTHSVDVAPQVWRRSTFGLFPSQRTLARERRLTDQRRLWDLHGWFGQSEAGRALSNWR